VYTDHKNLEYFNTTKTLNRRQHRRAEFLQPFNFKVIYREGQLNEKADALSRHRDLLLYKNRWYIPKDEGLRRTIMEAEHDSKNAGHFGTYKTIGRVRANFYWPKMDENITEYVRSGDVCQRNKVIRHKKYGLLELLEVPMRPWTAISMDFIVGLPKSDGYTKI